MLPARSRPASARTSPTCSPTWARTSPPAARGGRRRTWRRTWSPATAVPTRRAAPCAAPPRWAPGRTPGGGGWRPGCAPGRRTPRWWTASGRARRRGCPRAGRRWRRGGPARSPPPAPRRPRASGGAPRAAWASGAESAVHHEDVRRAQPDWEPRALPLPDADRLWGAAQLFARTVASRYPGGLVLQRSDVPGPGRRIRAGSDVTTVEGGPLEVLLWATGRRDVARDRRGGS